MTHPHQPGPLGDLQEDPDPLTYAAREAGVWSLPSIPAGVLEVPAALPPEGFDYGAGIILGDAGPDAANVGAPPSSPHLLRVRTDIPRGFDSMAHEATHRRYEPPLIRPIAQAAAGFSLIAAPNQGLHYVKLLALFLTLDAAGTVKLVQGPSDGTGITAAAGGSDLSGLMAVGGAAAPPILLPPSGTENPWMYTSPDQALGLFTVTGKAQGWAVVCYSPYDS